MTAPTAQAGDHEVIDEEWCGYGYSDDGWDESGTLSQGDWDGIDEDLARLEADMSVPSALALVSHWLGTLPLSKKVADSLMSVISCAVAHTGAGTVTEKGLSDSQLLDAATGARVMAGFADSVVVDVAGSLAARASTELLGRKGMSDPSELTTSGRARWRAKTKSLVAAELSTLTGWGVQECHTRVAVALAPEWGVGTARAALSQGATDWRSVSAFWQKCRAMEVEDAGIVDRAVFGPYLDGPDDATEDVARESWPSFNRRLCREVVRVEGADEVAARARRRAARDRRGVRGEICDDGLGSLTVTGPTTSVVAALDRIETISRRARKAGDPRPLDHIRSDTAMALLVHGILPLPGQHEGRCADGGDGDDRCCAAHQRGDGGTTDDALVPYTEDVQRIISGAAAASVDVIVPLSLMANNQATDAASAHVSCPEGAGVSPGEGAVVAEIPGYGFISASHARDVVDAPGTVIHRLLTDPADGRLVERSTATYRPDRSMVEQVRAADLFCRAPGCFTPAKRCELDHETPYGAAGGITSETNLNLKHPRHHQFKTEKFWSTVMDATRNVTWTTLFEKVYRTRLHDYRQYDDAPQTCSRESRINANDVSDADLRDRLIYAALCGRSGRDNWLEAVDDYADHPDCDVNGPPLAVFHRAPHQRRPGPPTGQSSPEDVLTPPAKPQPAIAEPGPPF